MGTRAPAGDRARVAVAIDRFTAADGTPLPRVLAWDLGKDETALFSYALGGTDRTVVIDDGAARRCARSVGLPVKGRLGVVS